MSADASGVMAHFALLVFRVIDSIMASRQLAALRQRVERVERHPAELKDPETGDRDQFQLYEVLYASGDRAGREGREHAAKWRQTAFEDGVLSESD